MNQFDVNIKIAFGSETWGTNWTLKLLDFFMHLFDVLFEILIVKKKFGAQWAVFGVAMDSFDVGLKIILFLERCVAC